MGIVLLVARLLLAGVFLVAGLGKLADRAGSRQAIVDFGVPARLSAPLSILLPLAELAVAAALIPTTTAWWSAVGALALLLLFVAGIAVNLARGSKPNCHCFGQLHSAPAGWPTLARNGVLAAVAGLIVWQGRNGALLSGVSWLGALSGAQLLALIGGLLVVGLLAAGGWFLVHLLRQNGRLLVRLEALEQRIATGEGDALAHVEPVENGAQQAPGLPVGAAAPTFKLQGLYGEALTLEALRARGKPIMLLFTDPNCGPCNALLPEIGRWQQEHSERLSVSLISRGTAEENRAKSSEHGLTGVLLQEDWEISEAYEVEGTPSAVLVQPDGTIDSPVVAGLESIQSLVARTVGAPAPELPMHPQSAAQGEPCPNCGQVHDAPQPATQGAEKIGQPAPPVRLEDLSGKTVGLEDFRGQKTLVLFWDPGCGFCQQMLDDLKDFEANPPEGAPRLLVVSRGGVENNKTLGLRSPVLTDEQMTVFGAFGTYGTPTAVLVDERVNIASGVAEGAQAVFALAGGENGQVAAQPAVPAAPKIGEPAPPLKLPDLKGKTVNLAGLKGKDTLVLFWNPGCGFCQQMLDDLKDFEANPPEGVPRLLVVSTGAVEDNRAMGLRSKVVLDQTFSAGGAFGANGTPSAVLVDRRGNIASEVAVGAPAVLALVGASQSQV
jgi:methylamine dehydrogenase accessory protein MauD